MDSLIIRTKGKESYGILDFDLHDVSSGIIHDNTRVMVQMSTEYSSSDNAELALYRISDFSSGPVSYNALKPQLDNLEHPEDYAMGITGGGILFDVTDFVEEALEEKQKSVAFAVN